MRRPPALLVSCLLASVVAVAPARAQTPPEFIVQDPAKHTRPQTLDAVASLGAFFGYAHFGVGGWYGLPLLHDGFVPELNDALYLEAGAMFEGYSGKAICSYSGIAATPMGGARWSVYLTPEWTVFATGKLGFSFASASVDCGNGLVGKGSPMSGLAGNVGLGAYWKFSDAFAARFELGYYGLSAGAGIELK